MTDKLEHYYKSVALTATFVTTGFFGNDINKAYKDTEDMRDSAVDMHELFVDYAKYIEDCWLKDSQEKDGYGVWDYEVSESFGAWFYTTSVLQGKFPSKAECELAIDNLVAGFWDD